MRKFVNLFFLLPLAVLLILLSVANRQGVRFSLDPLNAEQPALAFELPFFVFLFIALFIGMVIGGSLTWITQGKHRKALRQKSNEADELKHQSDIAEPPRKAEEIAPGLPLISSSN